MKIKICGMKFTPNRMKTESLPVDFLGFIFYPASSRYIGTDPQEGLFDTQKIKVGVFVNESPDQLLSLAGRFGLDFVQLHGQETPSFCQAVKEKNFKVIKAFNLDDHFDFGSLKDYEPCTDYFLFDTRTRLPGGSGQKFNWEILSRYEGNTLFFLSGGIAPGDEDKIRQIEHPRFFGVDLNSGFEKAPGLKNIGKINHFIHNLT